VALSFELLPSVPVSKAQHVVPYLVVNFLLHLPCGYPTPGGVGQAIPAAETLPVPLLGWVIMSISSAWLQLVVKQQRN